MFLTHIGAQEICQGSNYGLLLKHVYLIVHLLCETVPSLVRLTVSLERVSLCCTITLLSFVDW